ncbi:MULTISPECIES: DNA alkylation repair protein [unclassified Ensifer]|uniref:DNA alkylation repair protein n=1 Tax=unclassified Ensifer TaxID=2633371 RepID=UPI000713B721|nr:MULTISPECIES: DNA alkylation repair protein [unclassified Ensifer]KQX55125.1 DNA alkylation repair protein [Ensifer sp. Root1298]KQX90154.1 DNA alkylation repair protein [Ensifer sp. Root1312]KRC25293.1 DNA alkylation repair protein [Ensifer sp. Root74]KRD67214.1 DNA alkylation repair protein [Ensifer sp. Root954]
MAEPLKNLLHPGIVIAIADALERNAAGFDRKRFVALAGEGLEALELMQRSLQIRDALVETLPQAFPEAAANLHACLPRDGADGISGWSLLPFSQYVALRGLDDFDLSLSLLRALTPHFTAEFGIRVFIDRDQERALATIRDWTKDPNHHVRRLASEGTRPRLPWAMRLPQLIRDPQPILPILTALLDDPEEYVRRSVANSLNDIAKDHSDLVAAFVAEQIGDASPERRQLLRHASRTLLKQGHADALGNFGFAPPAGINARLSLDRSDIVLGESLGLRLAVSHDAETSQKVMIDYAVHHRKANGATSPKVFKWTSATLVPGASIEIEKRHAIRPITTRRYYPGAHRIVILVNGQEAAEAGFDLALE